VSRDQIASLCDAAVREKFYAVVVNPTHVRFAAERLADAPVKTITVVGFPMGANTKAVKVFETRVRRNPRRRGRCRRPPGQGYNRVRRVGDRPKSGRRRPRVPRRRAFRQDLHWIRPGRRDGGGRTASAKGSRRRRGHQSLRRNTVVRARAQSHVGGGGPRRYVERGRYYGGAPLRGEGGPSGRRRRGEIATARRPVGSLSQVNSFKLREVFRRLRPGFGAAGLTL
jgi:hypothetical protein